MYSARNLEMSIRFSLKSWPSERFYRPEMSQIKADIHLFLQFFMAMAQILCYKNRESIDIILILHFNENSTSHWYEG